MSGVAVSEQAAEAMLSEANGAAGAESALGPDPDLVAAVAMLSEDSGSANSEKAGAKAADAAAAEGEPSEDESEGQDGPGDEDDSEQNDEPESETEDAKDGSDKEERDEDEEGTEGKTAAKGRWARKQEELRQVREEKTQIEGYFEQLSDHAQFAFSRLEEVKSENERLRARLAEYEISEFANPEQERLASLELKLKKYEQAEAAAARQRELQAQAEMKQRAVQGAEAVKAAAQKYGLSVQDVFQAYSIAFSVDQSVPPAKVAKELAQKRGLLKVAKTVSDQVRANGDAVPASTVRGSRGAENIFADPNESDLQEAVRFLESLR